MFMQSIANKKPAAALFYQVYLSLAVKKARQVFSPIFMLHKLFLIFPQAFSSILNILQTFLWRRIIIPLPTEASLCILPRRERLSTSPPSTGGARGG